MNIFGRWAKRRKDRRYESGFNYAAGCLLRGYPDGNVDVTSVEYLEDKIDSAKRFGYFDEFDLGIKEALHLWRHK